MATSTVSPRLCVSGWAALRSRVIRSLGRSGKSKFVTAIDAWRKLVGSGASVDQPLSKGAPAARVATPGVIATRVDDVNLAVDFGDKRAIITVGHGHLPQFSIQVIEVRPMGS